DAIRQYGRLAIPRPKPERRAGPAPAITPVAAPITGSTPNLSGAEARHEGALRPDPGGSPHELRRASAVRVSAGRRAARRIPAGRRPRNDLRARRHRGTAGGAHRELPWRDQGQEKE